MTYEIPIIDYETPTMAEQVYQYIQDHPRCNRVEIAKYVGLGKSTVNGYLSRLRDAGRIRRHRYEGGRKNGVQWEVGREEGMVAVGVDLQIGLPRQRTVTTWEPETRRDSMVAALFGRAA